MYSSSTAVEHLVKQVVATGAPLKLCWQKLWANSK